MEWKESKGSWMLQMSVCHLIVVPAEDGTWLPGVNGQWWAAGGYERLEKAQHAALELAVHLCRKDIAAAEREMGHVAAADILPLTQRSPTIARPKRR